MNELTEERLSEILTEKLANQTSELKAHAVGLQEELARMTGDGFARTEQRFDEIETRLDVTEQIKAFERKFQKLEEALHIKL